MSSLNSRDVVIVAAQRTPIGSFAGQFATTPAPELAARCIDASIHQLGVAPDWVQEVLMGQVLSAGVGQAPARQAAIKGGLPESVPCTTISKVCGSGMKSVMLAYDQIRLGSLDTAIAGGMENMTLAPYLLPKARQGYRLGHGQTLDHMFFDGLQDAYCGELMGNFADANSIADDISREAMDAFTLASLERAQRATSEGDFDNEICPITIHDKSCSRVVSQDELPTQARPDKIPKLKPAFGEDGRVTAANASSISDGAAVLTLCSYEAAQQAGLAPLAVIRAHASHAEAPSRFTHAPIGSINKVLQGCGWQKDEVDLYEINEAFAMVVLATSKALKLNPDTINVNGGACALGHPIGASGARIIVTLLHALRNRGLSKGIASLCIGGGEATAIAIECL